MTAKLARWRSLPPVGRSRRILGTVVLGIAAFLVFAPKPWSVPLPDAELPRYDYYVKVYSWWGALVALCGAGLLDATASWWSRPWTKRFDPPYIWVRGPEGVPSWTMFDFLLREANIVTTPGSGFGAAGEGYFRISAFNSRERVQEAAKRLASLDFTKAG